MQLLQEASKDEDVAVVLVTHNTEFKAFGDTIIYLKDGKISSIDHKQSV
ncbi:ABC transporter ATP-binding protein [Streptococcus equi subsp. equi]|nr:ABC transporter ATP-binding protein [Streptococcus equi subsp. equi]